MSKKVAKKLFVQWDEFIATAPRGILIAKAHREETRHYLPELVMRFNAFPAMIKFVGQIARLTKEAECRNCDSDEDENSACKNHELYEMPGDDAAETLNDLIRQARDLTEVKH